MWASVIIHSRKKFEFKGYFDEPVPALIATDYKAPKTVLEIHYEGVEICEKENDNMTKRERKNYDSKPFTYASLFSGIGGFEQALNKLGGECVFASEIDKFAAKAYEVLYGHKPHGDITKIDAKDIPDHDLLVAGFPCQAFSVAGKRLGFDDTRGTLFFEIARVANEKKPKVLLLENVKGLVGHDKGRTLNAIIQTLCDIGYTVDFNVLNSKYFGVPQNRERVFIIAVRDDLIEPEPWKDVEGNTIVPKGKRRIQQLEGVKTFNFDWPPQTEVTTRLRDILEDNVGEKYYLSEEKTTKLVVQLEKQRLQEESNTLEPQMIGHIDLKGHDAIKRVYSADGVSPTLTTMGGGHREPKIAVEQFTKGDGISCCIDANYTKGIAPGNVGKGRRTHVVEGRHGIAIREATKKGYAFAEEGDSVNIQFPNSKTRRGRVGKQIANTLEANGINQGVVESPPKYRIRKLTPLECWRLQGFSDEAHEVVKAAGISDSQRYKQAGNAVTVNVVEAIGKRLLRFL